MKSRTKNKSHEQDFKCDLALTVYVLHCCHCFRNLGAFVRLLGGGGVDLVACHVDIASSFGCRTDFILVLELLKMMGFMG